MCGCRDLSITHRPRYARQKQQKIVWATSLRREPDHSNRMRANDRIGEPNALISERAINRGVTCVTRRVPLLNYVARYINSVKSGWDTFMSPSLFAYGAAATTRAS